MKHTSIHNAARIVYRYWTGANVTPAQLQKAIKDSGRSHAELCEYIVQRWGRFSKEGGAA